MDVIERLVVTINAGGGVVTSEIDGAIQCKSFLAGNPQIKVALNEDLAIGHAEAAASGSDFGPRAVVLDDCNFHESVALDSFDTDRALVLSPPEGEFVVMSYRTSTEFRPPFRVAAHIEETGTFRVRAEGVLEGGGGSPAGAPPLSCACELRRSPRMQLEIVIKLYADFPSSNTASAVTVSMPLPKNTSHASLSPGQSAGQAAEFDEETKALSWTFRKLPGGGEHTLRVRVTLTQERGASAARREARACALAARATRSLNAACAGGRRSAWRRTPVQMGPVSINFSIPMYNISKLQVRYLQILQKAAKPGEQPPFRWVRYITHSGSYVCRI